MAIKFNTKSGSCQTQSSCVSKDGCIPGVCPDFVIRRHDTKPVFKVNVEDCDGPIDFQGLVVEASMWALSKLKTNIAESDEYFSLADDVGFDQIMVGDIIIMDRVRNPEHMLVIGFDENNKLVRVQRAYHGTEASSWKKGNTLRIFRFMGSAASSELEFQDIINVDGTIDRDVIQGSYLVYDWQANDTCLPGCYWFEFKLLKMIDTVWYLPGGSWVGDVFEHTDGFFYTGTSFTDSSVKLSYDQIQDKYLIPNTHWKSEMHIHSDEKMYTGTDHDDGSVVLTKTGIPSDDNISYNNDGVVALSASIIPSFTDENMTPSDFGCSLGYGVEWVRRFPIEGEGFLIKIENSHTTEI